MRDINNNINVDSDDEIFSLRPLKLDEYIGQKDLKDLLKVYISTAKNRQEPLDHVLLFGPPGLGKTTLAYVIANEMNAKIIATSAPALKKPGDLAKILTSLEGNEILFIDEIHRLPPILEEMLYIAMEDFLLDISVDSYNDTDVIRVELPPFTLVGATTRFGDLSFPLRERFGIVQSLGFYSTQELSLIIERTSKIFKYQINADACEMLAKCSRGTPRIANRLFKRVRDFAQYNNKLIIDKDIIIYALNKLNIDSYGLDINDRKYLEVLIKCFNGGPVGITSISTFLNVEVTTIEDVFEPYLIQEGFIMRTRRGRIACSKAYEHLDIEKEK